MMPAVKNKTKGPIIWSNRDDDDTPKIRGFGSLCDKGLA